MRQDDDNLELPEEVKGELRRMYRPVSPFPAARDGEILRRAKRGRSGWRRWAISGAVAAAVAVAVGGLGYWQWGGEVGMRESAYVRTGDVRDAFYLARQLKVHPAAPAGTWDANGDGVVDEKDVRALALAAVRVEGGVR